MAERIAAIAAGQQASGVGILRISGEGSLLSCQRLFHPVSGKALGAHPPRSMVYGVMTDERGRELDRGLAFYSPAPHSYTGEETVELHCHGSPMVLRMLLEAVIALGARQARAGEFTQRAFLAGKLDLLQAEAVMDLIEAETPQAAEAAASQLAGGLSERISALYAQMLSLLARFQVVLDDPEEELPPVTQEDLSQALADCLQSLTELAEGYRRGRALQRGIPCAIIGRPNTGKSSLLNALLGEQRAIVTEIAGTTRDSIDALVTLEGVSLRVWDTAGLRESTDPVEALGVERSRRMAEEASLLFLALDGSQALTPEDWQVIRLAQDSQKPCFCLINKSDLPACWEAKTLPFPSEQVFSISAKEAHGLGPLAAAVAARFSGGGAQRRPEINNPRQLSAIRRAQAGVQNARRALAEGIPVDLALCDVEEAVEALGEVTGKVFREDMVGEIFHRFCVGK